MAMSVDLARKEDPSLKKLKVAIKWLTMIACIAVISFSSVVAAISIYGNKRHEASI